jgi:hypothetical protein
MAKVVSNDQKNRKLEFLMGFEIWVDKLDPFLYIDSSCENIHNLILNL